MNNMQSTTTQRSMAAVCRRREQLQAEGVRPEKLAWAVAEASEAAMELAETRGPAMVKACLERARNPHRSGSESEALLILSAAGVNELRRELRSVGVSLPLTRNEAFREIRQARRQPEHEEVFRSILTVGATRILAMVLNRSIPFGQAIAEAIVEASSQSTGSAEVKALTTIGGFGVRELHRGVKVDCSALVRELGVAEVAELVFSESPRRAMRDMAGQLRGVEADALAALSFAQSSSVRRAIKTLRNRARKRVFDEVRRIRRSGDLDPGTVFSYIKIAGPCHITEVLASEGSFERTLADEVTVAREAGEGDRADALTGICAFGSWRLRRGVRVDVTDQVREFGAREIAGVTGGKSPQQQLRRLARQARGEEAEVLAALSLVDPRRLERSTGRALRQRVASAMDAAAAAAGDGHCISAVRVHGTSPVAVGGKESESD